MKHNFDFKAACRDFIKEVNKDTQEQFYKIDVKTLQLRWTDIEIRKYRLNSFEPASTQVSESVDSSEAK
jgi:hypothetical protein